MRPALVHGTEKGNTVSDDKNEISDEQAEQALERLFDSYANAKTERRFMYNQFRAPVTPTLGDLRRRLREDGMPAPNEECTFDTEILDEEEEDRLPDCYVVFRSTCRRVLDGEFDHLSDSTPLEEI